MKLAAIALQLVAATSFAGNAAVVEAKKTNLRNNKTKKGRTLQDRAIICQAKGEVGQSGDTPSAPSYEECYGGGCAAMYLCSSSADCAVGSCCMPTNSRGSYCVEVEPLYEQFNQYVAPKCLCYGGSLEDAQAGDVVIENGENIVIPGGQQQQQPAPEPEPEPEPEPVAPTEPQQPPQEPTVTVTPPAMIDEPEPEPEAAPATTTAGNPVGLITVGDGTVVCQAEGGVGNRGQIPTVDDYELCYEGLCGNVGRCTLSSQCGYGSCCMPTVFGGYCTDVNYLVTSFNRWAAPHCRCDTIENIAAADGFGDEVIQKTAP